MSYEINIVFRVSKSYQCSLKMTHRKYENQNSVCVPPKDLELSIGHGNKINGNKLTIIISILSVVCQKHMRSEKRGGEGNGLMKIK